MKHAAVALCFLFACAAPTEQTPPAKTMVPTETKSAVRKPSAAPRPSKDKTVSIKVDATLDADALVRVFQKKLGGAGFRLVPDTDARFFITFKVKETQTAAPPAGREIARVQYVVSTLDDKAGIRLKTLSGDEEGLGASLDSALDAALGAVAEKVTPVLIAEMVARLSAED